MKNLIVKAVLLSGVMAASGSAFATTNLEASDKMMKSSMSAMHDMHTMHITGDTDRDFLTGMIPHHEGAIAMSEEIIPHLKDAEIKKFAQDIVDVQKKEIIYMKKWLEENPAKY